MHHPASRTLQSIATVALALGSFVASASQDGRGWNEQAPGPKTAVAALGEIDWDGWETIEDLLERVHAETGIPAIGAACVKDGQIIDSATVGVREIGRSAAVEQNDPFHLGSVTKSMTATVIGTLVEQGRLTWGTRVGDALGDLEMRVDYRDVTIENLLQHRGGFASFTDRRPDGARDAGEYRGTPTEIRAAFVADLLTLEPAGRPGRDFLYSNAGYALAGHIAERVTGTSWKELIAERVFGPLGFEAGGFGFPDVPAGHHGRGLDFTQTRPGQYPVMTHIAPAGNVHCSIGDLALYAKMHLDGLDGADGELRSETIKRLHTAPADLPNAGYAAGWRVSTDRSGEEIHSHGGTVSSSFAEITLIPGRGVGVVVLLNVGSNVGEPAANLIRRAILDRYGAPDSVATGGNGASGESFVTVGDGEEGGIDLKILEERGSPEEIGRVWGTTKAFALALNDEDIDAYLALFPPMNEAKRRDRESLFDFMVQNVLPARGSVRSFHDLSSPMELPDSAYPVRVVTFHLENGYPGYLGFSLDDDGKIDHLSLFVKPDLCPNGVTPACEQVVTTMATDGAPR